MSSFNLLPKEVHQQREVKQKKVDKTALFSAFLPLFAVMLWIVFLTVNTFIKRDINKLNAQRGQLDAEIRSYQVDRERNALLVLKTRLLSEVVQNDVNPENFFKIVQQKIEESQKDVRILSYGKDNSGLFFVEAESPTEEDATAITRIFREDDRLHNVRLLEINLAESNKFTIVFNINQTADVRD